MNLLPLTSRVNVPPNRGQLCSRLHGVTAENTDLMILIALETSNPTNPIDTKEQINKFTQNYWVFFFYFSIVQYSRD
jgi:hypothetical protein